MGKKGIPLLRDPSKNKYGLKGVCFKKGRARPWIARLIRHNKEIHLGSFTTKEAAGCAYNRYLIEKEGLDRLDPRLNQSLIDKSESDLIEINQRLTELLFKKNLPKKTKKTKKKKATKKEVRKKLSPEERLPKEILQKEVKELYIAEIVKKYNMGDSTIKSLIEKYNITPPSRKEISLRRRGVTKEALYQHLIVDNLSLEKTRQALNTSVTSIYSGIEIYGINLKDREKYNIINCPWCEEPFTPKYSWQICCTEKCREYQRAEENKVKYKQRLTQCKHCQKEYKAAEGLTSSYCSVTCCVLSDLEKAFNNYPELYSRVYFYKCTATGETFLSRKRISTDPFKNEATRVKYRQEHRKVTCPHCKKAIFKKDAIDCSYRGNFCSETCLESHLEASRVHRLERMKKWNKDNRGKARLNEAIYRSRCKERGKKKKRSLRRKKLSNITQEAITKRMNLFGVDVCCYCNKQCSPENAHDCTMEHLVPTSNGGTHDLTNLFRACGGCNYSKSSRDWKEWFAEQEFYSKEREEAIEYYTKNVQ
jgi:hypothetical protein